MTTTPDWERVRALFHRALASTPEERAELLRAIGAVDEGLAREVASLLAAQEAATGRAFLDSHPPSSNPDAAREPLRMPAAATGLQPGERLGAFEILAVAGRGGMGVVYKARDLRLDRLVAIKVLTSHGADDSHARERFEREARAISRLSHPHICTLHDVGAASPAPGAPDLPFLVMEFLEGRTLADRLKEGPLPPREVLRHALAIAEALTAAHAQQIVHRDLKPANIMLTDSGVKLLDFGLARLRARDADGGKAPSSASRSSLSTHGRVAGTLRYMSPEQLRGEPTDARSDIFAFGIVVHEMLTGRPPFDAPDEASVIAAVLTKTVPLIGMERSVPGARLAALVARCLEKAPDARWPRMDDVRTVLRTTLADDDRAPIADATGLADATGATAATALTAMTATKATGSAERTGRAPTTGAIEMASAETMRSRPRVRGRWPIARAAVAALALVVASSALVFFLTRPALSDSAPGMARLSVLPPEGVQLEAMQVSPDGRAIAFIGWAAQRSRVWIRALDAASARALPDTDGARGPVVWAPDSRRLAFFLNDALVSLDTVTGAIRTICRTTLVARPYRGSWSVDDVLLFDTGKYGEPGAGKYFSASLPRGLYQVPASGGQLVGVFRDGPEDGVLEYGFPHFLPDGQRFLLTMRGTTPTRSGVFLGNLDGRRPVRLLPDVTPAVFVSSGHLLFVRDGAIVAQEFEPRGAQLRGVATPIVQAERVTQLATPTDIAQVLSLFSASQNGIIAYPTNPAVLEQLAWYDRAGRRQGTVGEASTYGGFSLSRDGSRLAISRLEETQRLWKLWTVDLPRGVASRLTFGPSSQFDPRWAPDGRRVAVSDRRGERAGDKPLVGVGLDGRETVLRHDPSKNLSVDDWSPDGRHLLYHVDVDRELLVAPVDGSGPPTLIWRSPSQAAPDQARFSPDGRWVAYEAMDSGRTEVYVTRFPELGERWQVSNAGGVQPLWRADGRELYYLGLDRRLYAVPLRAGARLRPDAPRALFETALSPNPMMEQYAVDPNGTRFLLLEADTRTPVIQVVLNWTSAPATSTRR